MIPVVDDLDRNRWVMLMLQMMTQRYKSHEMDLRDDTFHQIQVLKRYLTKFKQITLTLNIKRSKSLCIREPNCIPESKKRQTINNITHQQHENTFIFCSFVIDICLKTTKSCIFFLY